MERKEYKTGVRIEWVDIVKGLLILSVIFGHAIQELLKVRGIGFEDNFWRNIIYSFHMPAFMAMSGYLIYGKQLRSRHLQKRFNQLIIPFLLWSIPLFVIYNNVDNIWEYVLYPNKGYWFLWALFFILVIKTIEDIICEKFKIKEEYATIVIAMILICCQMMMHDPKLFGYEYIAYYYIYFMVGYFARKYSNYLSLKSYVALIIFVLWVVMACFWTPNGLPFFLRNIPFIPDRILQLAYRMLTPLVFIVWMYAISPKIKIANNRLRNILIELGQISLGIYLVHMVVKNLFAQILFENVMCPLWLQIIIEFVLLTVFSISVVRLLSKRRVSAKWLLGKSV